LFSRKPHIAACRRIYPHIVCDLALLHPLRLDRGEGWGEVSILARISHPPPKKGEGSRGKMRKGEWLPAEHRLFGLSFAERRYKAVATSETPAFRPSRNGQLTFDQQHNLDCQRTWRRRAAGRSGGPSDPALLWPFGHQPTTINHHLASVKQHLHNLLHCTAICCPPPQSAARRDMFIATNPQYYIPKPRGAAWSERGCP
jgi:hypothetical protein